MELEAFHALKDTYELIRDNPNFSEERSEQASTLKKTYTNPENTERIEFEVKSTGENSNFYTATLRRSVASGGNKLTPTGTYVDEHITWRVNTRDRKDGNSKIP